MHTVIPLYVLLADGHDKTERNIEIRELDAYIGSDWCHFFRSLAFASLLAAFFRDPINSEEQN